MISFSRCRLTNLFVAIPTVLVGATALNAADLSPRQHYAIPSQSLGASIKAVAVASGRNVIASGSVIGGRSSPPLEGTYTAEEALAILLAHSGLHTVAQGNTLIISSDHLSDAEDVGDEQAITVTGTHIRGAPISSPVISLSADRMAESGKTDLGQIVRALPQSFGGGQNPGIGGNVPAASGVDVSGGSSINLRGLGSDATLTLLNGHRLAYNASRQSVDVSAIPIGAVDRIEIVPDGASALYGSDAIAGVANIILKKDYAGIEAGSRIAGTTDGGGFQQQYDLTAGRTWRDGAILASYEYGNSAQILSDQRSYARATSSGLTLFPPLRHHSAAVSGHQAVTESLTLSVDALFNVRWSHQDSPQNAEGDPRVSRGTFSSNDRSYGVAPTVNLKLGGGWQSSLAGTIGREKVEYEQIICEAADCANTGMGYYRNGVRSAELDGDGPLFDLPGGTSKLALGAGYRTISFRRENGEGSTVNTAHDQASYYAFGEINLPVIGPSQGWHYLERLNVSGALRYERYPGIGDVVTPKIGLIIAPTADVDIKGSWGKSFRAPTLYQQYQPNAVYVYAPSALGATGLPASATALLIFGGNRDLKPERATTWSTTVDLHPRSLAGAHLALSYFNVRYRDRIVTPISFVSQALSNPIYRDQVTPNPSASAQRALIAGASAFANFAGVAYDPANVVAIVNDGAVNAGSQKAHGVDMLADYTLTTGPTGHLRLSLNASYLVSTQQLSASQPITQLAGSLFNPPHWRGHGTLSWTEGPFTVTGDVSVTGGVDDSREQPSVRVEGMTTADLTFGYRLPQSRGAVGGVGIVVSAQNLFNAKPHGIAVEGGYDTPYDSTNYSPIGRLLSVGITKSW